jgi:23S rRNA pseudouridine1911/1915/1917 synthase
MAIPITVLFEDNHLLVVEKPVNIPVQEDSSGDIDLLETLKKYLGQKYEKPGKVFLGLVHRLDRPVGGVMVFARTSKAASRLSDEIRRNQVDKTYHVVVLGTAPEQGELVHWLVKDERTNMVTAHENEVPSSKKAVLRFRRVGVINQLSLLQIDLETGRSHQIRVQCASMGHPVWGDQRYNKSGSNVGQQIALFASALTFSHPVSREKLTFSLPIPNRLPFSLFR